MVMGWLEVTVPPEGLNTGVATVFKSPNTATLEGVPTYTFPLTISGVMNLFLANWSRAPA
jgi:hypothetical protein